LEIRNRVVQPASLAELEVSNKEVELIMQVGFDFYNDLRRFVQWFSQKEQKMIWDLPGKRTRYLSTTGRNQLCPCGSGRKYKNCCGPG
jgi:preprotein translocase subunit SecA